MKNKIYGSIISLTLVASFLPVNAQAQLKITEAESQEAAGGGTADWWELTNFGNSSVDLTGFKFNDDTGGTGTAFVLPSLSIAAGESVVFVDNLITPTAFRNWWGAGLGASVQVINYPDSGFGFGAGGDQVNLWDTSNTLVDGVVLPAATQGHTFGYDPAIATFGGVSQPGINGAFAAVQNGDIGSPGVVPEPSAFALLGLGATSWLALRRRK